MEDQKDSGQAGPKVIYTSREVEELKIPYSTPPKPPERCRYCGKPLYYEGVVLMGRVAAWRNTEPQRCDCEKAREYWTRRDAKEAAAEQERKLAAERKARQERIDAALAASGIKKRFMDRTFETFRRDTPGREMAYRMAKSYVDGFDAHAQQGEGLYIEGTCGTGKTHLAVAIAMQLIGRGIPVIIKTSIDLLGEIKRSYDTHDVSEYEVTRAYKDADLLIVDDLGKELCTDWSLGVIYEILNDRYEEKRPTIITTNFNESALIQRLTPKGRDSINAGAIISRLRECAQVLTMAWEDFRGKGDNNGQHHKGNTV